MEQSAVECALSAKRAAPCDGSPWKSGVVSQTSQCGVVSPTSQTGVIAQTSQTGVVAPTSQNDAVTDFGNPVIVQSTENISCSKQEARRFDICSKQEQSLLKNLSTDGLQINPIKRCRKCLSCVQCKRHYLPDVERQLQQVQIIKDRLSFKDGRYTVSYPYNALIADLPENKRQCQLMMVSLERKLQKTNLIDQFNEAVRDFTP